MCETQSQKKKKNHERNFELELGQNFQQILKCL